MWRAEEDKLTKSGRKWKPSTNSLSYRYAELFCECCGTSLGEHDIVCTNLETTMYCGDCVTKYIKDVPFKLPCGTVVKDFGGSVLLEYDNSYYDLLRVDKICYFNKKGRYIKVKGKRYYL